MKKSTALILAIHALHEVGIAETCEAAEVLEGLYQEAIEEETSHVLAELDALMEELIGW